jgi:hypothetical protein
MNPENVYSWTLQQQPKINISQKNTKKQNHQIFHFNLFQNSKVKQKLSM